MLKADFTWTPRPGFSWPCTMEQAAGDIALSMGVELDPRNVFLPYQMNEYPMGEYMRRDALRDIAAAHGGNWHMSDAGRLRLVPLLSAPAESSLLVTEHGDAILFGGGADSCLTSFMSAWMSPGLRTTAGGPPWRPSPSRWTDSGW